MDKVLVLIVEDEPLIQLDLEQSLHDGGYTTIAEASGEAAIAKLQTDGDVRALVTDINLGSPTSGWEVARRARELFPGMPVVYVTSAAADEWASQGVPKSVLIQKPFAPAQILTAVSNLLTATDVPVEPP